MEDLKKLKVLETKNFVQMVRLGVENLNAHLDEVNDLNVFPVPDGDTGTNMKRTIETGYDVIKNCESEPLYVVAQNLSKGMLLGARGNSGVILSQIFRGFSKGLAQKKYVTVIGLIGAFKAAVKQAYNAVVKPVEGTILTVLREAVEKSSKKPKNTIYGYLQSLYTNATVTLANTKEMLDVLKEADVIDSGGAGLTYIFQGFLSYFEGSTPNPNYVQKYNSQGSIDSDNKETKTQELDFSLFNEDSVLDYGYCTEFILQLSNAKVGDAKTFDEKEIIDYLTSVGESVVCFKDGTIVKTHVHTKDPGAILSYVRRWGEFLTLKIENMALQHNNKIQKEESQPVKKVKPKVHKTIASCVVAQGEGLISSLEEMGVDAIVNGKQTMNPSTEDFISAFDTIDADNIFVFPNNSNIILAAEQAQTLYKDIKKDVNVIVIKTKSIAQGYIASTMMQFAEDDVEGLKTEIESTIADVSSLEITTATRDTVISGVDVMKGHYIGILNHNLVADNKEKFDCVIDSLNKVEDINYKETLLIIVGKDSIDEKETAELVETIKKAYPSFEISVLDGGQDVYSYIIAVC